MSNTKTRCCAKCGEPLPVDIDRLISSAEYAIDTKQYYQAAELLSEAKMIADDYRIYYHRAKIELEADDDGALFKMLEKLQLFKKTQKENEVTLAIKRLMKRKQNGNGMTILHCAVFYEQFDMIVFCVEHGSDVNATYYSGENKPISPLSMISMSMPRGATRNDGILYRTKSEVNKIRQYLISHGATDKRRFGK